MNINSPFICCGVCYKDYLDLKQTKESLCLTSCAHITCSSHLSSYSNGPEVCPICQSENITTIVINQSIPSDLKLFFTPVTQQLNSLSNSCQHQFNTLINKIEHLTQLNNRLNDKIRKQKEFLYAAKEEITHLSKYKSQVEDLKQEIDELNHKLEDLKRPETFDLTNLDEIEYGRNNNNINDNINDNSFLQSPIKEPIKSKPFDFASNTFINKINQQSINQNLNKSNFHQQQQQKPISKTLGNTNSTKNQSINNPLTNINSNHRSTNQNEIHKRSFFAESTKIGEFNNNNNNNNNHPLVFSSGTTSITSSRSGFQKFNNKYGKSNRRSATSQLASRLTANMRIGTLNDDKGTNKIRNNIGIGFQMANTGSNMIGKGPVLNKILKRASSGASHHFQH
ncbi:hypothetical protein KGF54_004933 [Candida jiufengensis]|uniref:uncharacterized protein n=1 Tax=Candida jiufengensis TaxID=497108 RepID=UPI00222546BC|nr:uncharacterized protein KGF54_004933 [Candida jiufengensis]KAI5951858.1 hypothetical protein KGF54_004933 [Candida jiufengensis]